MVAVEEEGEEEEMACVPDWNWDTETHRPNGFIDNLCHRGRGDKVRTWPTAATRVLARVSTDSV